MVLLNHKDAGAEWTCYLVTTFPPIYVLIKVGICDISALQVLLNDLFDSVVFPSLFVA